MTALADFISWVVCVLISRNDIRQIQSYHWDIVTGANNIMDHTGTQGWGATAIGVICWCLIDPLSLTVFHPLVLPEYHPALV